MLFLKWLVQLLVSTTEKVIIQISLPGKFNLFDKNQNLDFLTKTFEFSASYLFALEPNLLPFGENVWSKKRNCCQESKFWFLSKICEFWLKKYCFFFIKIASFYFSIFSVQPGRNQTWNDWILYGRIFNDIQNSSSRSPRYRCHSLVPIYPTQVETFCHLLWSWYKTFFFLISWK